MDSVLPKHTEVLLRSPDPSKGALKEKFVAVYEALFAVRRCLAASEGSLNGVLQGGTASTKDPRFWEEVFLLRVNAAFLERCILLTSEEQLLQIKVNFQLE